MVETEDDDEEFWFDGWHARFDSVRRKDNPHPSGTKRHDHWKQGWDDASAHLAGRQRVKRLQERQ